jgi:anthranilate phosphoribosyltransferase
VRRILAGATGPQREVVLMNAAAALVAGGKAKTLPEGATFAAEAIDSGRALERLDQLVKFSQSLGVV